MTNNQETRRPPVMRDVARLAGVSHQTVSRVLNDSPLVSDEARERVLEAVAQLGYRLHASARALATRRTMHLGVICVGVEQYGPSVMLVATAAEARRAGYITNLHPLESVDRPAMKAALDTLTRDSVDGIIVIAPTDSAAAAVEGLETDVPLVMFEPGIDNGTTKIAIDESLGARLATQHLLDLGHRTVHHVSGPRGWLGTRARIDGWRSALSAAGRPAPEPVSGDWSSAGGHAAGQRLARDPDVTAVFAANDQMAIGVIAALSDCGRHVPDDVSVVGFDDLPEVAWSRPALTTVDLDFAEVGRRCVSRLLLLINGENLVVHDAVRPGLRIRESSAPPRPRKDTP